MFWIDFVCFPMTFWFKNWYENFEKFQKKKSKNINFWKIKSFFQKLSTFFRWKIYIIFDYNALLSILYLIFWCFYNYFWCFRLSLSVFHDFLGQNLILLRLTTSLTYFVSKMNIYMRIFRIFGLWVQLYSISHSNSWYKNNLWKIEISIFCKIFKKKWKIHDYDTPSLSHIIMNFRAIWVLVPSKFQVFSKVFEFLKFYKILSFLVKICLYGWKQIFGEVGNFILAKIHGKQTKYKI